MFSELKEDIKREKRVIDKYISEFLERYSSNNPELARYNQALRYYFDAGGKRIRPYLTMKFCKLFGGNPRLAFPICAAVEIIHQATLIHDDIEDQSKYRRGVKTLHAAFDIPTAITSGTHLISLAYLSLTELEIPKEDVTFFSSIFSELILKMIEGQYLDIENSGDLSLSEVDYFETIRKKTGELLKIACIGGALISGKDRIILQKAGEYGINLGMAFQIQDDVLDITGKFIETGKSVGNDIKEGKVNLIVIHFLQQCSEKDKDKFLNVFGNNRVNYRNIKEVIKLFKKYDSIEYAKRKAIEFSTKAKNVLSEFNSFDNKSKDMLIKLADYVVLREK